MLPSTRDIRGTCWDGRHSPCCNDNHNQAVVTNVPLVFYLRMGLSGVPCLVCEKDRKWWADMERIKGKEEAKHLIDPKMENHVLTIMCMAVSLD